MNQPPPVSPIAEFKDRRSGLIGLGILVILVGCVCALLVPLMLLGQAMSAKATGGEPDYRMMIPAAVTYAVMAVAFVWLGIGSIMARRWARALLLILAWGWLVMGVVMVGFMAVFLPKILESLTRLAPFASVRSVTLPLAQTEQSLESGLGPLVNTGYGG
jgi:peptidoglycan biosynthesis protein MviN/MurJ (putative lipid II flippase)